MARIIPLSGPPVNTHFKKNLHAFKNLAVRLGFYLCSRDGQWLTGAVER